MFLVVDGGCRLGGRGIEHCWGCCAWCKVQKLQLQGPYYPLGRFDLWSEPRTTSGKHGRAVILFRAPAWENERLRQKLPEAFLTKSVLAGPSVP